MGRRNMKRIVNVLISVLVVLLLAVSAVPVLAAAYSAAYVVVESSGNAYSMLPVLATVDNQWLAANGFMATHARDTRVGTSGGSYSPHSVADNKTFVVINVPANSNTNLRYTTGNSTLLASLPIITGYGGYITAADLPNLELGNTFSVEVSTYLNAADIGSIGSDLVAKPDAVTGPAAYVFRLYISFVNTVAHTVEITAAIYSGGILQTFIQAPNIPQGVHVIRTWGNGANLNISVDGIPIAPPAAIAAVDDVNDPWQFLRDSAPPILGRALPYANYITITTNIGAYTEKLWYQPLSYIVGTLLPDRDAADNNGTIVWGANPVGVSATIGNMISSGQPGPGVAVTEPPRDVLPDIGVSDWFQDPDITGSLTTNPIRPFVQILSNTTTLTELQAWRFLGLALVLFATVLAAVAVKGHLLIAGIACGASIGLLVQQTVWPTWALVFIVPAIIGGLIAERTPSI